jgi:hypothetical protein
MRNQFSQLSQTQFETLEALIKKALPLIDEETELGQIVSLMALILLRDEEFALEDEKKYIAESKAWVKMMLDV